MALRALQFRVRRQVLDRVINAAERARWRLSAARTPTSKVPRSVEVASPSSHPGSAALQLLSPARGAACLAALHHGWEVVLDLSVVWSRSGILTLRKSSLRPPRQAKVARSLAVPPYQGKSADTSQTNC